MKTKRSTLMVRWFISSAGAVLLGLALAMVLANLSKGGSVRPRDPVLEIPMSSLLWGLASLELLVASVCLLKTNMWLQVVGILWLSANSVGYWFALQAYGNKGNSSMYFTSLADTFGMSCTTAYEALEVTYVSLFVCSGSCLFWLWHEERQGRDYIKNACNYCGGHIAFPASSLGRTIACPHCEKAIVLRRHENLKTLCYFCKGHIEFPVHAIGDKVKCPHCKMDITLLELHEHPFDA